MNRDDKRSLDARIAVIGLSCRFPGAADASAFWSNLVQGRSGIVDTATDVLSGLGVGKSDLEDPNVQHRFGALADIDRFDADFFSIPPRRAALLDPQQRLLLETAWHAMEDAGHVPGVRDQVIGTYVSLTQSSYFPEASGGEEDAVFLLTAGEKDYAATRIAHKLGLTGPAMVVQSACSSALLAVHTAIEALIGGQCTMALAGGASVTVPQGAYRHVPGLMLSPSGRCHAFDARADGTVPGNGVGIVALKTLAQAIEDGDPIRAVLAGSAANNDGAVKTDYLAPSVIGQAMAVGEAYAVAGIEPGEVGMIEAHATGTRLGDPIEVRALNHVFGATPGRQPIALGSIKASIGHLNAASGIAGLIKTILAVEHDMIPPSLGYETPNPEIDFSSGAFEVAPVARAWPSDRERRIAGVSSFGFGGTNVHVVVEQAPASLPRSGTARQDHLFVLSARDPAALRAARGALANHLRSNPDLRLDDVAHTLRQGRTHFPCRWTTIASDQATLIERLLDEAADTHPSGAAQRWRDGDDAALAEEPCPAGRRVALPGYPFADTRHWAPLRGLLPAPTGLRWSDPAATDTTPETAPAEQDRNAPRSAADVGGYLAETLATAIGCAPDDIDREAPLSDLGLDSLMTVGVTNQVKKRYPALRDTALFEHETVTALARYLAAAFPGAPEPIDTPVPTKTADTGSEPIAVIGMAGRYPGSEDLDGYWKNLREGRSNLAPAPLERWDPEGFFDPGRDDRSYVRNGGFLRDIDRFDPVFFGIAPKEARVMDPQQRLFLEICWNAIEDAGYAPAGLKASAAARPTVTGDVGVYAGVMNQPYRLIGHEAALDGRVLQTGHWSVANRVSFHMDFTGPSIAVDTACSASLTAVHLACAALRRNECAVAVAGGVNLVLHPVQQVELCRVGMLSRSDACRPFADGADGTLQGEGVGAVVLKPLRQALADGDAVRAVILGSAIDAGGRTSGYTVPNPRAQRRAVAAAVAEAGIDPNTLGYVECHGTGTDLGDPIEAHALADGLDDASDAWGARSGTVQIGSVKGNIGHLESAAGIAGLTKLILSIENAETVPTLGADTPSRRIDFGKARLALSHTLAPWPAGQTRDGAASPRRGGVSSFGAGGANVHVVLEQAPDPGPRARSVPGPLPFALSARDPEQLADVARRLADWLDAQPEEDGLLADVAFTLAVGRAALECRRVVMGEDKAALAQALRSSEDAGPRALPNIATQWVDGVAVDWQGHFGPGRRRVHLPVYRFAGQRYWLGDAPAAKPDAAARPGSPGLPIGRSLSLASDHPLVRGHRVNGRPTVPGVASVLWAMAAARAEGHAGFNTARDVIWLRPIAEEDGRIEAELDLTVASGAIAFAISGRAGLCCRGRLERGHNPLATGPDQPRGMRGGEWTSRQDGRVLYDALAAMGLDYAGPYRAIKALARSDDRAMADCEAGVAETEDLSGWPLSPALLDAALQTAAGLLTEGAGTETLVPFSCSEIVIAAGPAPATQILAVETETDRDGGPATAVRRHDAVILARDGAAIASVRGLVARPVRSAEPVQPGSAPPLDDSGIGAWFFTPFWCETPPDQLPRSALDSLVLITAPGAEDLAAGVLAALPSAHPRRIPLPPPGDEAAANALSDAVIETRDVIFALGGTVDDHIVLGFLTALRSLKTKALQIPLRILVLTERVQRLRPGDSGAPRGVAALGIARTASRECPAWRMACVDVLGDADVAAALRDPGDALGREIAYRDGQRHVARLRPTPAPVPTRSPWRTGGHYLIVGGSGGIGGALAEHLARRHAARFTLIGRSAEGRNQSDLVSRIEAAGGHAIYHAADVCDRAALDAALADGRNRFGPLAGVVHSALMMQDHGLETMTDARFEAAYAVKAAGTEILLAATADDAVDFVLLFSSANSFAAMAGQANYVAGGMAQDSIGLDAMALEGRPVRVVNWGFWGETGRVATPAYHARLAKAGVIPLTTAEGLDAIDRVLCGDAAQVLVLKAEAATLASLGVVDPESSDRPTATGSDGSPEDSHRSPAASMAEYDALDRIARLRILRWWADTGLLDSTGGRFSLIDVEDRLGPSPRHARMIDAMIDMLTRAGVLVSGPGGLEVDGGALATIPSQAEIDGEQDALLRDRPGYAAHFTLLDHCIQSYEAVLRDRRQATEVLFPGGGLDRVEPMYAGNAVVDHFNALAAKAISEASSVAGPKARLLEIGGGTGGLTKSVLPLLDKLGGVGAYRFTDLSPRFRQHAMNQFAPGRPWFEAGQLDVSKPLEGQALAPETFDIVIAANVIHATPSIADSLATIRSALKPSGTLVLYEMMALHDFVTATFGLLDGWWMARDERLPHSPLLDAARWRRALDAAGFRDVEILDGTRHGVIIARRGEAAVRGAIPVVSAAASVEPAKPTPHVLERPADRAASRNPLLRRRQAARNDASRAAADGPELHMQAARIVTKALSTALELPVQEIRPDRAFVDYGTDSILSVDVVTALNQRLGIELKPTVLFSHSTVEALARYLVDTFADALSGAADKGTATPPTPVATVMPATTPKNEAIAIIGASGRYPGADDLDRFWDNLASARDCITPVPSERWDHTALHDPRPNQPGRTNCPDGGFLNDIDLFDPLFFGLSPAEAMAMDPQQRLFLEEAWRALEDAGAAGPDLAGSATGVFVGAVAGDYAEHLRAAGLPDDAHGFMGNAAAMMAARVAYHFDLTGPAFSVDTACSSSLVALHQAAESLRRRECDMALAGGVAVMTGPRFYVAAANAGMLSPSGRCKTLDAAADGFVPGEGVGAFVLKRLEDAIADGDLVRAVILASGVNQDGASNGITAPNGEAQTALLRDLYRRSGIDPESIGYFELHGTGTRLGDPIEMDALGAVLTDAGRVGHLRYVGSVKSAIGHGLASAGSAALAKVMLSLEHRTLPPTLHLSNPNPLIDFSVGQLEPVRAAMPWPESPAGSLRRAAISSFGFGGTNAHLVVEEAPAPSPPLAPATPGPNHTLVMLSAASPAALEAALDALARWLATAEARDHRLIDIAGSLATGRKPMRHRANFIVASVEELRAKLSDPECRHTAGIARVDATGTDRTAAEAFDAITSGRDTPGDWQALRDHAVADAASVDWRDLFTRLGARRVRLPTYRFERRRCWPEGTLPTPANNGAPASPTPADPDRQATGLATLVGRDLLARRFAGKAEP